MADAPPKKKLPFKQRKKYTAPAPTPGDDSKGDNNDELDLFSRRKEMQPILEADRRRRIEKEKRKAEAAAKEKQIEEERLRRWKSYEKKPLEDDDDQEFFDAKERQAPTGDVEGATTNDLVAPETESFNRPMTPPSSKRKRGESGSAGSRKHPTPSTNAQESKSRSLRSSAMSTPSKHPTKATAEYAVISIDSDDDGNTNTKPAQRADSIEIVDENHVTDEDEEDDEFAELIRAAEEEKKRLAEQTEGASAGVLLTSEIEGTKPASLKIKLDQHLVKALDAWVTTQLYKHNVQLPCPAADLVISWRREKVYHYSTLLGLGVRTEGGSSTGAITGVSRKGLSEDRSKVHLEISTPEIFQRWEEERRKEAAPPEASDDELAPVVEEEKLRVILRARDLEDVKLTVRPATTARTLVEAYKRIRGLEGKNITLWFDGDQLSGESTLEQMDIDDLDTVEVHIN